MITPDVIKKIEDQRREKGRTQDHRVPVHKEPPMQHPRQETPRKQEDPGKTPDKVIEISVV